MQQKLRTDDINIKVVLTGDELREALKRPLEMPLLGPKNIELGLKLAQQASNSPFSIAEFLKSKDPLAKARNFDALDYS